MTLDELEHAITQGEPITGVDLGGLDLAADRFSQRTSWVEAAACWWP
jgi:hypothetical protein